MENIVTKNPFMTFIGPFYMVVSYITESIIDVTKLAWVYFIN